MIPFLILDKISIIELGSLFYNSRATSAHCDITEIYISSSQLFWSTVASVSSLPALRKLVLGLRTMPRSSSSTSSSRSRSRSRYRSRRYARSHTTTRRQGRRTSSSSHSSRGHNRRRGHDASRSTQSRELKRSCAPDRRESAGNSAVESPIPSAQKPGNNVIPTAVESANSSALAADKQTAGNKKTQS